MAKLEAFPTPVGMNRIDKKPLIKQVLRSPRLWG